MERSESAITDPGLPASLPDGVLAVSGRRTAGGGLSMGQNKMEKRDSGPFDTLPDGVLQSIFALVPGPSRRHARLVSQRFYELECSSRESLHFRTPCDHDAARGAGAALVTPLTPLTPMTPKTSMRRAEGEPVGGSEGHADRTKEPVLAPSTPLTRVDSLTSAESAPGAAPSSSADSYRLGLERQSCFPAPLDNGPHRGCTDSRADSASSGGSPRLGFQGRSCFRTSPEQGLYGVGVSAVHPTPSTHCSRKQLLSDPSRREMKPGTLSEGALEYPSDSEVISPHSTGHLIPPYEVPTSHQLPSTLRALPAPSSHSSGGPPHGEGEETKKAREGAHNDGPPDAPSNAEPGSVKDPGDSTLVPLPISQTPTWRPPMRSPSPSLPATPTRPSSWDSCSPSLSRVPDLVPSPSASRGAHVCASNPDDTHSPMGREAKEGSAKEGQEAPQGAAAPKPTAQKKVSEAIAKAVRALPGPGQAATESASVLDALPPHLWLARLLSKFCSLRSLHISCLHASRPDHELLLLAVAGHARQLQELRLSGHSLGCTISDTGMAAVARGCPRLTTLMVHHWALGRDGMAALADAGRLRELEMDFFARDNVGGARQTVSQVARCRSLTSLHVRYCNDDDLTGLALGCPSLSRLTLLFSLLGPGFTPLGQHCTTLNHLTLRSCDAPPLEDPLLRLSHHCSSLHTLKVHAGHVLSDPGLKALLSSCPSLYSLSLEFQLLKIGLGPCAPHLAQLRELTLQWVLVHDSDLVALSRRCSKLTLLVLSLSQNVSDAGVSALVNASASGLQVLSLRTNDLSDITLRSISAKCAQIQRLTLSSHSFTLEGIETLLRSQSRTLRRLRLLDSNNIEDAAFGFIAKHCPRLEGFGIRGCAQVTEEGIRGLMGSCKYLNHMEVEQYLMTEGVKEHAAKMEVELVELAD